MCMVSIKVNDNLLKMAGINTDSDVDISEWMQQKIEALLIEMALSVKNNAHPTPQHSWDNYELSPEILAMMPEKRRNVYGDYKAELSSILEEKYNSLISIFNNCVFKSLNFK